MVLIEHSLFLYSQVSHLQQNSVTVKEGDYVSAGFKLACAGNSGRSFEPHIHLHFQKTPEIGSPTCEAGFSQYLNYNEMQGSTYVYYDNTKPTPSYSLGTCSTPVPAEYSRVCHIIRTSSDGTQTADWTENYDTEHTIWNNQVNKNYPYSEDFSVQCYYQNSSGQKFLQSSVVGSSAKVAHSQYKQSCNTINVCNETTSGTVDIDGMCSATPKSVSTCSYTNSCGLPITGYQCPSGCTATSSAISDTSCIILNSDRSVIRPNGSVLLNWDFNNSNINPVCSIYDFTSSPSTLIPGFQNIPATKKNALILNIQKTTNFGLSCNFYNQSSVLTGSATSNLWVRVSKLLEN
jgi:hypothetical protein